LFSHALNDTVTRINVKNLIILFIINYLKSV